MTTNVLPLRARATDNRQEWQRAAKTRLIRARNALGWSQAETGVYLNASCDAVGLWERGERKVPGWVLVAIECAAAERVEALVA